MSGMEVVAVLGCVAAVVSAYKDGGKIVKQIKAKRAAKKALAPTQSLESSLERGPIALEQAKDNGIERYGPRFATGDQVATEALRNILIKLQGTLLKHLWSAQEDDNMTDFHILVDASDFGRIQSVTVLNELYMRMAQTAPLHIMPLPAREPTADPGPTWEHEQSTEVLAKRTPVPLSHQRLPLEDPIPKPDPDSSPDSTRKKWGLFSSRARKRESELAPESLTYTNIHELALNDAPLGIRLGGNVSPTESSSARTVSVPSISSEDLADTALASSLWKISAEMTIDEENPWREETSISTGGIKNAASTETIPAIRTNADMPRKQSREVAMVGDPPRLSQEPKPMRRIAPYKPRKTLMPEALSVAEKKMTPESKGTQKMFPFMARRVRRTSLGVPQNATPTQAHSSSNPYGGYCKGAYKLQVGLDKESVNLRNQSTSMTGQSNYWACANSNCAYEGPACRSGNNWVFDDTVRVFNAMQFRWSFLFKCHVALPKVKNRQYDYQCVFCGVQASSNNVYRGEELFIEHVSQQHRGQQPDPSILDKICCIYGRVALEEESFDVNLTPREDPPLVPGQVFVHTPNFNDHGATPDEGMFEWPTSETLSSTSQRDL